jgi:hypothetical protein
MLPNKYCESCKRVSPINELEQSKQPRQPQQQHSSHAEQNNTGPPAEAGSDKQSRALIEAQQLKQCSLFKQLQQMHLENPTEPNGQIKPEEVKSPPRGQEHRRQLQQTHSPQQTHSKKTRDNTKRNRDNCSSHNGRCNSDS